MRPENKDVKLREPTLELLGGLVGKTTYMELAGEEPLVPERREIALRGKIVAVDEYDKKTITIEIPLGNVTSLCEGPISYEERDGERSELEA